MPSNTPDTGVAVIPAGWKPPARLAVREMFALAGAARTAGPMVAQPSRGSGSSVVLVPGFLAGDWSLRSMHRALRRGGHRTFDSGITFNAECTSTTVDQLERRLEQVVAVEGSVTVVGHSRGGTLARLLATRRPDLVRGIVTLGSPLTEQFAAGTTVLGVAERIARRNAGLADPTLLTDDCLRGNCAERIGAALAEPVPEGVAFASLYSRTDGVVWWRACLDPGADLVEVLSSHNGMAVSSWVHLAVRHVLDAPWGCPTAN